MILVAAGVVVAILVLLIVVDFAAYHNKIHAGVSVGGQSLGGLTREEAVQKLNALVAESQKSEITYTAAGKKWTVSASSVGAKVDVNKTVSAALAASTGGNFVVDLGHRIALYFKGKDVPAQGTLDTKAVEQVIAGIAGDADQPAANAQLTLDNGVPNVTEGKSGTIVNRASVREDLKGLLFTLKSTQKPLPMMADNPVVKAADTQQAVAQAKTMMSSALTLTSGSKTWAITPQQMANYFDFKVQQENGVSTLVPYLSAKKMSTLFADVNKVVTVAAQDAKFVPSGKTCTIQPSVDGKQLDQDQTAAALTTAAMTSGGRTAQVVLTTKEADLTTAKAQAMGIKDVLGTFSTSHVGTTNRQQNVRITANYASDVLLAPGEIYDFIKTVGPRTPARGYLMAPGIVGPGKLEDVFGGGICQVSTTLFNAAFVAGLQIVERKNHSLYISHYPAGRDATVSDNSPNMRFRNDTKNYIYVYGTSDGIHTTFTIFGTSDGRKVSYTSAYFYGYIPITVEQTVNPSLPVGTTNVIDKGQQGMHCKVTRTVTMADGTVVSTDFLSYYPMVPKQVEVGGKSTTSTTAKTTPTTTKSTTTTTH
jgi:vancomycin resistance protein YoaR